MDFSSQICEVKYWRIFANRLGDFLCNCQQVPGGYRSPCQSSSSGEETEKEEVAEHSAVEMKEKPTMAAGLPRDGRMAM
jgi:hypothetical protein